MFYKEYFYNTKLGRKFASSNGTLLSAHAGVFFILNTAKKPLVLIIYVIFLS